MRIQLFKGTYVALLGFAMAGLFLMLLRQTGSGYSLAAWLGLIVLAAGGLVASNSDLVGIVGALVGLCATIYLKWNSGTAVAGGAAAPVPASGALIRIDIAIAVYILLGVALVTIWIARRRAA